MSDLWCLVYLSRPLLDESSDMLSWLPNEITSSEAAAPDAFKLSSLGVDGVPHELPLSSEPSEPTRKLTCFDAARPRLRNAHRFGDREGSFSNAVTWLGRRPLLLFGEPLDSDIAGAVIERSAALSVLKRQRS